MDECTDLPVIEGQRVRLRPLRRTDAAALFTLYADPEVCRYWSFAPWTDLAQAEAWLDERMLTSRIHRRKPKGKSMPIAIARANAAKSSIRARIEHVFAHQKNRFGLFIRTIGITRAEAKLTLANLAYNFDRLVFHEKRVVTA